MNPSGSQQQTSNFTSAFDDPTASSRAAILNPSRSGSNLPSGAFDDDNFNAQLGSTQQECSTNGGSVWDNWTTEETGQNSSSNPLSEPTQAGAIGGMVTADDNQRLDHVGAAWPSLGDDDNKS